MTGFTIEENFGANTVRYDIHKNGKHSGAVTAYINGDPVIEELNFTTAQELSSAISRAQVAVLARSNVDASITAMETEPSQDFVKYAVDNLRRLATGMK